MPTFSPISGGGIPKATVSASSGATVDTTSRPGKTIYKFTGSGSITVSTAGTCEVLVIGGGGGGGNSAGGGAGGFLYAQTHFLASGLQTVTVGAGGARDNNGSVSKIASLVAIYGGTDRSAGASGGGGASTTAYGSAIVGLGQGNNGAGNSGGGRGGGGGGGAGSAGTAGSYLDFAGEWVPYRGGAGGTGSYSSITGTSVAYSGGGGGWTQSGYGNESGGLGGAGGGGRGGRGSIYGGSYSYNPDAGVANTGGGGGGGNDLTSASGGSGIVIVVIG